MSKFTDGIVVYHKATGDRCVVIKTNEDGTIKVRTEKDLERDYTPQELKTQAEVEQETQEQINRIPKNDRNWGIG